jgi:RHS repeat-associated protein
VLAGYALDGSPYALFLTNGAGAPGAYVIDESNGVKNDSIDLNGNQNLLSGNTLTDSSGNVAMTLFSSFSSAGYTDFYTGPDGNQKNIVVSDPPFKITGVVGCPNVQDPGPSSYNRITKITLPDGTFYSFTYDAVLGRPEVITLPTGGQIVYTYNGPNNGVSCVDGGTSGFTEQTPAGLWKYARAYNSSTGLWKTTVTDPQLNQTVYTFGNGSGYLILGGHAAAYQVNRVQNQLINGQQVPLKTTVTCYNGNFTNCATAVFPTAASNGTVQTVSQKDIYTYLPGVSAPSLSEIHYQFSDLVTEDKEYDFGASFPPGTNFIRDRKISYQAYNCPLNDTTNGSGSIAAETTYKCDVYAHPTSVSQLVSGSTFATTRHTYYNTGLLETTTDPNGNLTSYSYGDCNNSFLTKVTNPAFSTGMTWNCNGEVVSSATDPNNIKTNYSYNDPLDRLTLVDSAPGTINWATNASAESKAVYSYPSATERAAAQDQTTTGDGLLKNSTFYDSLGRAIKTVARDGSVIETAYDPFNRVCAVSNPTFTDPGPLSCVVGANKATAATDGYTYFSYDALGRKTLQTQPDATTQRWGYTGNVVDFYDEDNSHWQWTSDALGRLTIAKENDPAGSGALSLQTVYTCDALNNLLSVNQTGASGDVARYRTFAYDSMSLLTNACNPESIASGSSCSTTGPWSAAYTYDADGNVKTRTDARGIVTNYTYDALNRLKTKTYPNDTAANTPALTFGYDTEYPWQLTQDEDNPVGHLNSVMATVGTTNLTTWTSGDYDQRGNLTGYVNCLGSNAQSCPGAGVGANYSYDLNEDLTGISEDAYNGTYNGQYDYIAYGYDPSGRVNSIATSLSLDNSGSSLTSTAFSGETYYPGGAVETAKLAIDPTSNVAGITLSRTYDKRSRITGEVDTDSLNTSPYHYGLNYDANSNVTGYNDSVAGSWTATYDALHRLVKSTGTMNGVAATFQQTYDHFGNRNVEYFTYNGTQTQPSPYLNFTTGNNRAAGSIYDNAGNLYSDGTNDYLYDAENRLCAVKQLTSGDLIGYVYAANGPLLGRGNLTTFSCDVTKNGLLTANGLALTNAYMVGPEGERLEEMNANFDMLHYNVFWEGKLLGTFTGTTYAQSNWHFALHDWVGTKREITTSTGAPWTSLSSGPFGDYASQTGSGSNPSEEFFTGKVRDTESGLDDFLARHYSSNWGRFMSPDWSASPVAVPYADINNPQSLNLYSYVKNNPLSHADADGHVQLCGQSTTSTNANGDTVINANCVDLPDPPTRMETIQNWYKSTVVDPWNARIAAHAPPPSASRDTFGAEEIAKAMMIVAGAGWYSKYDTSITKSGSVTNVDTDVSVKSAGENLEANGYSKSTASDGTPTYTKGDTQYTIYNQATSTGGPTAQVKINGDVVAKIRLKP